MCPRNNQDIGDTYTIIWRPQYRKGTDEVDTFLLQGINI